MRLFKNSLILFLLVLNIKASTNFMAGSIDIDMKSRFVQIDSNSSLAIGSNINYKQEIDDSKKLGIGFDFAISLYESEDGVSANYIGLERSSSGESSSYFALSNFYLNYAKEHSNYLFGRFDLDTPLASSNKNSTINKNSFQGILSTFKNALNSEFFLPLFLLSY